MSESSPKHQVELTRDQLLKVRIALINTAKEWDEQGDSQTAQDFRDVLKPFTFRDSNPDKEDYQGD